MIRSGMKWRRGMEERETSSKGGRIRETTREGETQFVGYTHTHTRVRAYTHAQWVPGRASKLDHRAHAVLRTTSPSHGLPRAGRVLPTQTLSKTWLSRYDSLGPGCTNPDPL